MRRRVGDYAHARANRTQIAAHAHQQRRTERSLPNELSFQKSHSWRGQWWVPGGDDYYPGVLQYTPHGGARLELGGVLPDESTVKTPNGVPLMTPGDGHYKVLHGVTDGRPVTLLDCLSLRTQGRFALVGGHSSGSQDLSATMVLLGIHLEAATSEFVEKAHVRLDGLTGWAGRRAIEVATRRKPGVGNTISSQCAEDQVAVLGDTEYRLVSFLHESGPRHANNGTTASVRHEVELSLSVRTTISMDALRYRMKQVADLVALARRASPALRSIQIENSIGASARLPRRTIDVLWQQSATPDRQSDSLAFTAEGLGFETIMTLWRSKSSRLQSALNLLLAVWRDGWIIEAAVLAIATAVESLSSSLDLPSKMSRLDFAALRDELVPHVPSELQDPFCQFVSAFNTPSLLERYLGVANCLPEEVRRRILPDPDNWAKILRNARNGLSHTGSTRETWETLATLRQVTASVVYLALLSELDVAGETIMSLVQQDSYLSYACERSRRDLVKM